MWWARLAWAAHSATRRRLRSRYTITVWSQSSDSHQAAIVAATPKRPGPPRRRSGTTLSNFSLSPTLPKWAIEVRRPAMLNPFVAEVSVTVRSAAAPIVSIGMCVAPGIDEVRVDLVRNDRQVVGGCDLRDAFELCSLEYPAGRVVRIAEQDHGRLRSGSFETFEVHYETDPIVDQRVFDQLAAGGCDKPEKRWVDGSLRDDAVARPREGKDRRDQSLDDVGIGVGQRRIRPPIVPARHPVGKGVEQRDRVRICHLAVAVVLGVGEPFYRGLDGRRDLEVHVRDESRDDVGGVLRPLAAAASAQLVGAEQVTLHVRDVSKS